MISDFASVLEHAFTDVVAERQISEVNVTTASTVTTAAATEPESKVE